MTERYAGGCLCKSVRYRLDSIPRDTAFCHCESCRRIGGAAYVPWGTVDRESFNVTSGRLAIAKTSPNVERGYCRDCGSPLTYRNSGRPGEIDITLVSLDDAGLVSPGRHIWVVDKLPWVHISDGLPQYDQVEGYPAGD